MKRKRVYKIINKWNLKENIITESKSRDKKSILTYEEKLEMLNLGDENRTIIIKSICEITTDSLNKIFSKNTIDGVLKPSTIRLKMYHYPQKREMILAQSEIRLFAE